MSVQVATAIEPDLATAAAPRIVVDTWPAAPPSVAWSRAKRGLDLVLAIALIVVLAPVMLAVAIAVRLDSPGPALFRQQRCGRHRRPFMVLKFRTMFDGVSPEAHRRYIERLARAEGDAEPGLKKLVGDARVTRVGAFLRRASLDELPQLFNVVRGQMSIVGPRPALEYELEHYRSRHFARFDVRPGITGLGQVSGRNAIGFLGMLDLDAEYARSTGLRVDAVILLRTPLAVLRRDAA
jgi:lipopolysaccharide/colanic/teichoic acid biosynthesis glycosyltransferase